MGLLLILPPWGEPDQIGENLGLEFIHALSDHVRIGDALKFFEIVAFVAEPAILVAITAITIRLADPWIFCKWHHTTLALVTAFGGGHSSLYRTDNGKY
jgi:hypothetical protein